MREERGGLFDCGFFAWVGGAVGADLQGSEKDPVECEKGFEEPSGVEGG